jgi:hypothetical protein
MSREIVGHYILGITTNGNKFRPSDWIERIASVFASFGIDQRLRYNPLVIPARTDGMPCLFVASSLASEDPTAYRFVMDFANSYQLQVKTTGETEQRQPRNDLPHVA